MESKYLCPVCLTQPIYDYEGNPLSGESLQCESCQKFVCGPCGYTDEDRRTMFDSGALPEYLYDTYLTYDFVCHTCIINAEKDLIDEIPKENLPCHINDIWYEDENKEYFNKKLQNMLRVPMQTIATSRKQIPASFKKISWIPGSTNLDLGAGKYPELITEALRTKNVTNTPWDPQNPSISVPPEGRYDTVTINNVLNVIKNKKDRENLVLMAMRHLKYDGTLYIQIYEGDKSGVPKKTRDGWQNNATKNFYTLEIAQTTITSYIYLKKGLIWVKHPLWRDYEVSNL